MANDEKKPVGVSIEDINALWAADCSLNLEDLAHESGRIGHLHSKYYKLYIEEKLRQNKREEETSQLRRELRDYYSGLMTREQLAAFQRDQWPQKLTRQEANDYIEADDVYLKKKLLLSMQIEKVEYLKAIIHQITQRSFNIRNAVEWKKFEAGF